MARGRPRRPITRPSPKPEKRYFFCPWRRIEDFCPLFSTHQRPNMSCQTSGQRSPHITGRRVNTVTRGWVGTPNERAPFRIHRAVVGFIDRCLSRAGNLAASNKHLAEFSSGRSWTKICPGIIFSGFLKSLKLFFRRFVHIASGAEIFWRVSLKFELFLATSRFHCHRSVVGQNTPP